MFEEPLVAVLPAAHALAARRQLTLSALRREPFVFFRRALGPDFYDRLIGFCTSARFAPRVIQEATQWQSVVSFVEAGMGVSLAPGCVRRFNWKGVVYRPLPGLLTSVIVCWRSGSAPSTVAEFLRLARAEFLQPRA